MCKNENTKTMLKLKTKSVFRPTSETSLVSHQVCFKKKKRLRFSASKHVHLSPAELKRRSLRTCNAGATKSRRVASLRRGNLAVLSHHQVSGSDALGWHGAAKYLDSSVSISSVKDGTSRYYLPSEASRLAADTLLC